MVEMIVFGLALDEDSQVPILILKDKTEDTICPIWIGAMEAMAISMVLNKVAVSRPLTHDLILNILDKMAGQLEAVEIVSIHEGTYYAELVVRTKKEMLRIDCRPSDSIALALRAEVPIRVSQEVLVLNKSLQKGTFQEVVTGEESEKWTEILSKYSLDDIKYKM
ncbi:MAG: bifunctional nuclease family protein [Desulfomicrobium sp.]|nr:bifunctional nuclease family protein [Desulfomicrobium sp.]